MGRFEVRQALATILLIGWASFTAAQEAPDRFAFVVGNAEYEKLPPDISRFNLRTPANDAKEYVRLLDDLGWTILNADNTNRTERAMLNDLDAGSAEITSGSEVVFVYSGHGFSDPTGNYLVGTPENDQSYTDFTEMRAGSVNLNEVVERLSIGNPARIILIINACGDEPLDEKVSRAPRKPTFDTNVQEVLVLYSSSPGGVAYDYVRTTDFQRPEPHLSVFTRAFADRIDENRPLLDIFMEVRREVERLSGQAADDRGLAGRGSLQIPHILYDTINGEFNLANVSSTAVDAALRADWRIAPQACRFDPLNRDEALAIRSEKGIGTDSEGQSVRDCIVAAALGDLGIEKLTYSPDRNGPVISQSAAESAFATEAVIRTVTVTPQGQGRQSVPPVSIDVFYEMLANNYFAAGTNITFGWQRDDGGLPPSGFLQKNF